MRVWRRLGAPLIVAVVVAACAGPAPRPAPTPAPAPKPLPGQRETTPATAPAPARPGGYYLEDGPGTATVDPETVPDAVPRIEPLHPRANRPYSVFNQTYTPMTRLEPFRERGLASWYGRLFHGQRTSSGEVYDMYAMTAAHPTLPIPSFARVTSTQTGRSVVVRINDRGPFLRGRVIDLSWTAASKLGYVQAGSGEVEIELITDAAPMLAGQGATSAPAPVSTGAAPRPAAPANGAGTAAAPIVASGAATVAAPVTGTASATGTTSATGAAPVAGKAAASGTQAPAASVSNAPAAAVPATPAVASTPAAVSTPASAEAAPKRLDVETTVAVVPVSTAPAPKASAAAGGPANGAPSATAMTATTATPGGAAGGSAAKPVAPTLAPAPLPGTTATSAATTPPPAKIPPPATTPPSATASAASAPPPATAASSSAASTAPAPSPTPRAMPPVAARPPADATESAASPADPAPAPGLYLQIGAFAVRENALSARASAAATLGLPAQRFVLQPAGRLVKVLLGPFAQRADAQTAADRLAQASGQRPVPVVIPR